MTTLFLLSSAPYRLFWRQETCLIISGISHNSKSIYDLCPWTWKFSLSFSHYILLWMSLRTVYWHLKQEKPDAEEVIIDYKNMESILYQTVASKRVWELCIDCWYLSESISWSVMRASLKITLKYFFSLVQKVALPTVFLHLRFCVYKSVPMKGDEIREERRKEKKEGMKKGWKELMNNQIK